jgi:hypothetical protein
MILKEGVRGQGGGIINRKYIFLAVALFSLMLTNTEHSPSVTILACHFRRGLN